MKHAPIQQLNTTFMNYADKAIIKNRQIVQNGKISNDEKEHVGGGVALLVKDSLTISKEIALPEQAFTATERANAEMVGAEIKIGNKFINVFSLYNPPGTILNEKLLSFISKHGDYILVGDLNAKLERFVEGTNRTGTHLESTLQNIDGKIVNDSEAPTFFRYVYGDLSSKSTLDLVLVSESLVSKVIKVDTLKVSAAVDSLNELSRPSYFHLPLVPQMNIDEKHKKERTSFTQKQIGQNSSKKSKDV